VLAACPQCSTRIQIDDAKVPDRPFNVKCPKCANVVKLPGRGQGASAASPSDPAPALPSPSSEPVSHVAYTPVMPVARPGERALVSFADRNLAATVAQTLTRLGYSVETVGDEEGARLLEQGYAVAAAARVAGSPGRDSLYQRITRLSPDSRRRVFAILVGDEFKTGDGTQAWAVLVDLVVSARDASSADNIIRTVLAERNRMYQVYLDARKRWEEAVS
jgi:predicted Zn finger-like uncharacterized protein